MRMTFYTANCRGNAKNSLYPNRRVIDNEDDCLEVMAFDHVCAEFKGCRRGGDNFLSCDVDVMDCDNSHSDNPAEWIHPEDLEERIGEDVAFAVVPSRNNMKPKEGRSARPRFHVYFPHDPVTDGDACAALKRAIQQRFPFFDAKALDSARFIFGHPADSILWHEGEMFNAKKAVELGFADEVMFSGQNAEDAGGVPFSDEMDAPVMFSRQAVMNSMLGRLIPPKKPGTPAEQLEKRLNLLLH